MQDGYSDAINAQTKEEFFGLVKKNDPKSYIIYHDKLEYYAEKIYAKEKQGYQPEQREFRHIPVEMREWVTTHLISTDRPKTLVVWGPSRMGKTSWARSLGNHCYIGYTWSIRSLDESSDYLVCDDIELSDKSFRMWQPFLGK
jgi:hypothetical protein